MRIRDALPVLVLALAATPTFVACGSATSKVTDAGGDATGSGGKGGTPGTAGTVGSGGTPGTGGIMGSAGKGGTPGTAGTVGSGGTPGTAGTVGSGGTPGAAGAGGQGGKAGQGGKGGGGNGGAGGAGCVYNGVTRAYGTSFPTDDGCNTCTCTSGGQVACTLRACPAPDGGAAVCTLDAVYQYGMTGGHVAYSYQSTLTPPRGYKRARIPSAEMTCSPALPACETANAVDVADIMRDVADPDVQAALAAAKPPLYGYDPRPTDGSIFSFTRSDGHGFLMGGTCPVGTGTCKAPLPGIMRLTATLLALDEQQVKDDSCKELR